MEEDAQDINDPIIKQIKPKEFDIVERTIPPMIAQRNFMENISKNNK